MTPVARPAWYALEGGGWRDYVTELAVGCIALLCGSGLAWRFT